jgi:hypothetical protein
LMHLSGNYRIIKPAVIEPAQSVTGDANTVMMKAITYPLP